VATEVERGLGPRGAAVQPNRERVSAWRVVAFLAPFALALTVYIAVFFAIRPHTTGDEPHYLLVAQSIAYDGDVDLTNDYASRDRTLRVLNFFPLGPHLHAADYKGTGELRPLHGVGLSALLAPAVGLGGLTAARLLMVLIAALLADQLYRLLRAFSFRRRYRNLAWVAVAFCLPVLVFSNQFYPELPAALLVVASLRIMVERSTSAWALALGSSAAAALLWLHVRYIPLSLAVFLGLAYAAFVGQSRINGVRPRLQRFASFAVKGRRDVTVPLVLPYAIGAGLLAAAFLRWYGSIHPSAPYNVFYDNTFGSSGWKFWYEYALADLLHPVTGWIPYVPVHWVGLAALGCLIVRFGWPAAVALSVALAYELALASGAIPIGFGLPARYLIIVIPLIAIPLAVAIQHVRAARYVALPLLAGSLVFAVAAVRDFEWLYPLVEKPRTFGVRSIDSAFPRTRELGFATSFSHSAGGRFPPNTGEVRGDAVIAREGSATPGFMLWGPYSGLRSGSYHATFPLAVKGAARNEPVATIEAVGTPEGSILARKTVLAAELQPPFPENITLSFPVSGRSTTEVRVYYHGNGTLVAGPVRVRIDPQTAPSAEFRDWPLVFLWLAGTVLTGALFVQTMKPRPLSRRQAGSWAAGTRQHEAR
jgi:hypothetical protein